MIFTNYGYCLICNAETEFLAKEEWLREYYVCKKCGSIPRQRALIHTLNLFAPEWKQMTIHESSPNGVSSDYIRRNCLDYSCSFYYEGKTPGSLVDGNRCENLSAMTYSDNTFDLIITQDVFEHVIEPVKAFKEINRILKPGGLHVFTMPWYPQHKTLKRAELDENGEVKLLEEAVYHGNPIDAEGALVTYDYGYDFVDRIYKSSGMTTTSYLYKNRDLGIDGEFLYVFISRNSE